MMKEWQQWSGQTVICIASGPSLNADDCEFIRSFNARKISVNNAYKVAPWADVHYSSDHDWWEEHYDDMRALCLGQFWTGYPDGVPHSDVHCCPYDKRGRGLSMKPGVINWGGNSGYCAIGLAVQFGAKKIVLTGYDQQDKTGQGHYDGNHPDNIRKLFNFPMWRERFGEMAKDAEKHGIQIINASRETSLTCFPRASLLDALVC
jgi:hypothetical protein